MYHYVRNLKDSRYPEIKGLDVSLFQEQLDYLGKNYNVIKMEELLGALDARVSLPPHAVLLTFDDAYADHFTYVFPMLDKKKWQGSFFAPVKAVMEHKILDVNKIHFILATVRDKRDLIAEIFRHLDAHRESYHLESNDHYYKKLAATDRFDSPEVIFIKRLLQVELVEELRMIITDALFRKFVSSDEVAFSQELYMNVEQIQCMQRNGMHFGAHGDNHYWLGSLSRELQEVEIARSAEFLKRIGVREENLTMCYPYGSYNSDTLDLLKKHRYKTGLTTRVAVANIGMDDRLTLPRLDTNDIPKSADAQTNKWYSL
jgi:peptidoglycan/xylan/chitin deacetylase (PgdA/CDA1 family)